MFHKGDRIRVRDDFDWHSHASYTQYMEGLQGKVGVVKIVTEHSIHVNLNGTDNSANWNFQPKDLEVLNWQRGDKLTVRIGAIDDDCDHLYYGGMRHLEGTQVEFRDFTTYDDEQAVYVEELDENGNYVDGWTLYLHDVICDPPEIFNEEFSLETLLA